MKKERGKKFGVVGETQTFYVFQMLFSFSFLKISAFMYKFLGPHSLKEQIHILNEKIGPERIDKDRFRKNKRVFFVT